MDWSDPAQSTILLGALIKWFLMPATEALIPSLSQRKDLRGIYLKRGLVFVWSLVLVGVIGYRLPDLLVMATTVSLSAIGQHHLFGGRASSHAISEDVEDGS